MTIQSQIFHDIQSQVACGKNLPFSLTLHDIARYYQVSPMPVRQAVEQLVRKKVLIRQSNGRLDKNEKIRLHSVARSVKKRSPIEPKLIRLIVSMSLKADEHFLREEVMSSECEVGRTVLRRLFLTLAGSGMLIHVPRRGWRVRPFREKDLQDYIQIRLLLEPAALEQSYRKLNHQKLTELLQLNSPDENGKPQLDNSLHRYWIEESGNAYIQQFFSGHGSYHMALLEHAALETHSIEKMSAEHRKILQALLDRNLEKAKSALIDHIQSQIPTITRLIQKNQL